MKATTILNNVTDENAADMIKLLGEEIGNRIVSYGFRNFAKLLSKIERLAAEPWDIFLDSHLARTFDARFKEAQFEVVFIDATDQDVADFMLLIETLIVQITSDEEIMQGLSDLLSADGTDTPVSMVRDYLIYIEGAIERWIIALINEEQYTANYEEVSMRVNTAALFLGEFHA